jgi:dTDP-4-amino-4,6-dideoxygalactose transaminase
MTDGRIPFVDLGIQQRDVAEAVRAGFDRVLEAGTFILGPEVEAFEREFAAYCGVDYAVGVGNGTDALELALRGGGLQPGDEVIIPANTFVATAEAVVRAGGFVRLVDCDENFLIDVESVKSALGPRTKAIIGVHLYGQAAPIEALRNVAGDGVLIVEDAAQSQGARRGEARAGGLGDVAATSFYPGKNLGAYGDAGAVLTNSPEIAERIRMLRNHGGMRRYEHLAVGTNSRLDGLQAVVLSAKLGRLDGWNQERRDAAAHYGRRLASVAGVVAPVTADGNEHVFHLYVVRVPLRDQLVAALSSAGIGVGIHYPCAVHLLPAFSFLGLAEGDFPVAEKLSGEIISLPMYPGITIAQQDTVVDALIRAMESL